MSHEFETGFFVQTPPWHQIGTLLIDAPQTAIEAITAAGLDWFVTKESLEAVCPRRASVQPSADKYCRLGVLRQDPLGATSRRWICPSCGRFPVLMTL